MCELRAPAVFEIDLHGELRVLQDPVDVAQQQAARDAVAGCPTRALRLEERAT
jgi:ferredoxin